MTIPRPISHPPFCPRPSCPSHRSPHSWCYKKAGHFSRSCPPRRVQRYLCLTCRASFSDQTFRTTYWLKRPRLLPLVFHASLACSGIRQIARSTHAAPSTIQSHLERLGRHCLLFQNRFRPHAQPAEPVVVDGFETFEFSQYHPVHFHVAVGARTHYFHAFTDSELRRKGRMTVAQKRRREELERLHGRPDPKSIEKEMAELIRLLPGKGRLLVRSDEHPAYRRAFRRVPERRVVHEVTPSKAARTTGNPLFPVNLLDGLIRHSGANHKRETIAFSKRRAGAAMRLAILQVWRNFIKSFSERKRDDPPGVRAGVVERPLGVEEVLGRRLFPWRERLPGRLMRYYRMEVRTRRIPRGRTHRAKLAD